MYYDAVQWQPSQLAIVSQKFAAGGLRKLGVKFTTASTRSTRMRRLRPTSTTEPRSITPSALPPLLPWILCYPTGTYNGTTHPSALVTGANGFSSLQCSINGKTMFNNPLTTLEEQYAELKQAMNLGGDGDPESLCPFF